MFASLVEFLDEFPPEVVLHIFTYLDLPDLASISKVSTRLAGLASDPVLHQNRLRIIAPSRVQHSLFALGPQGGALRPTIPDLVHRGVVRGLNIERRWRDGVYFYTQRSIMQYENSIKLSRRHAAHVINTVLRDRQRQISANVNGQPTTTRRVNVGPDVEFSSTRISRLLFPVMHKLKWSFQRDKLAKVVREMDRVKIGGVAKWLEDGRGKGIMKEGERVRLAVCPPDVRRKVGFYESLA